LLNDNHTKEVTQITNEDAKYAVSSHDRIIATLKALNRFVQYARLSDWYGSGSRSTIPLYFIAYHIFHKQLADEKLASVYDNYDTNNPDFLSAKRWIYLSFLNGVFSRGCGWIPYRTGIRKILNVIKHYRGQIFPTGELFSTYVMHPLAFSEAISAERVPAWDLEFVLYLIYTDNSLVGRDVDHIHPRALLDALRDTNGKPVFSPTEIHATANMQLLDVATNRGDKRARNLADWIQNWVKDRPSYLDRHLIPDDPDLWQSHNLARFLEERSRKIVERVELRIPQAGPAAPGPVQQTRIAELPEVAQGTAHADWRALVPAAHGAHPILSDETSWRSIYKNKRLGRSWPGRFSNELGQHQIETVSDMAAAIIVMGLEHWMESGYGPIYRFRSDLLDGSPLELNTREFGAWGWKVTLEELQKRGFDWRPYLAA